MTWSRWLRKFRWVVTLLWILMVACFPVTIQASNPINAIVGIEARIPFSARTAGILGTDRRGSGVLIDNEGLVVTIGYLILEAEEAQLIDIDGQPMPATIVGYDNDSGFGLVRAILELKAQPVSLGQSVNLSRGDLATVVNHAGSVTQVFIDSRTTFVGTWEYVLENAIYTIPAVPDFSGAALIDQAGELVGIGSLFLRGNPEEERSSVATNMFVPIDQLKIVMEDLIDYGRPSGKPRPWLGINVISQNGHMMITRVTREGPADFAGMQEGDIILGVNGQPVHDLESLFRAIWNSGSAGIGVSLTVLQRHLIREIKVISKDRYEHYRLSHIY